MSKAHRQMNDNRWRTAVFVSVYLLRGNREN
jgi:hypothetical protein